MSKEVTDLIVTKCLKLVKPFEVKALCYMSCIKEGLEETKATGVIDKSLYYLGHALLTCRFIIQYMNLMYLSRELPLSHLAYSKAEHIIKLIPAFIEVVLCEEELGNKER